MSRSPKVVQIISDLDYWLAVQVLNHKLSDEERGELARSLREYLGPVPDWAKSPARRPLSRFEQDRLDDPEGAGMPGMPREAARPRKPEFSYIRLPDGKATVACTCGWQDPLGPMPVSPFDPAEAFAAAQAEHPRCPEEP